MPSILVVVVSCHKNSTLWQDILSRNPHHTLIICGGFSESTLNGKILQLKCSDEYDSLPEKMMYAYEFIMNNSNFNEYTHILKADDHDTYFTSDQIKEIEVKYQQILNSEHYIGQRIIPEHIMGRRHHFPRVLPSSKWYNKMYTEPYFPYLGGGETYILSRGAMSCIIKHKCELDKHVLEDAMMGYILIKYGIHPYQLNYGIKTWNG